MAYSAALLNRLVQFGRASYDLVVTDGAGVLPEQRSSVSWPLVDDATLSAAVPSAAPTSALALLRDAEIARNLLAALEQGNTTFLYSTPSENIAAVRSLFSQLSGWDAIRLGNYISGLGLTNAQYTNFFGYSGAALTTFKNKLAQAVTNYNSVIATQGG